MFASSPGCTVCIWEGWTCAHILDLYTGHVLYTSYVVLRIVLKSAELDQQGDLTLRVFSSCRRSAFLFIFFLLRHHFSEHHWKVHQCCFNQAYFCWSQARTADFANGKALHFAVLIAEFERPLAWSGLVSVINCRLCRKYTIGGWVLNSIWIELPNVCRACRASGASWFR